MRGKPTWSMTEDNGETMELTDIMNKRRYNIPEDALLWKFSCYELKLNMYLMSDK